MRGNDGREGTYGTDRMDGTYVSHLANSLAFGIWILRVGVGMGVGGRVVFWAKNAVLRIFRIPLTLWHDLCVMHGVGTRVPALPTVGMYLDLLQKKSRS